ncbi:MAG: DUF4011 domain-containing protein [Clostridia bacterium]|nr:DUF4011 domain-containing protein [Clostridia bacterium]
MAAKLAEPKQQTIEISLNCSSTVGYYNVQNEISPIKRLYIKNLTYEDMENVTVTISSSPAFILPMQITQEIMPRRANVKFEPSLNLSPLFMVALDKRLSGKIIVSVFKDNEIIGEERCDVQVLAFNECNYKEKTESIATFVKRSVEINRLISLTNKKLDAWNITNHSASYAHSNKNSVRYYFAAAFSQLAEMEFVKRDTNLDSEIISSYSEMLSMKIVTPLELSLVLSAMLEGNGYNAIIGNIENKWYVGCFLINECFSDVVVDDASVISKKLERGVNDISMVNIDDIFNGLSFEKAEKNATDQLKRAENIDFFLDIKRSRILSIRPLPERIKTENGYDLVASRDFELEVAPKQIKEYKGDIAGETEISRERQWERKLLEMDMRNSLLNFRISHTSVKILTANLDDFIENIDENVEFSLAQKPTDATEMLSKLTKDFDRGSSMKPIVDYLSYEYKNKRLRTLLTGKDYERTLLNTYRKEKSIQEESGTATLYLAAGFLRWKEDETGEDNYAPILLYPATLTKRGVSTPVYSIQLNTEELHLNYTLLEFLYQEFNLDMRGLASVKLDDAKSILAVIARIRKEIVDRKGWEVHGNVFLCSLSFTNYLMWYDVKHKIDKFKENKIINSLIQNRSEFDVKDNILSENTSDNAYFGDDRILLPISADSSQYSAIRDSLSKSFVLHGPPGTGKSQTITNIIANNIVRGRRVLFVAEKMAALSVVYRRIKEIGIADFCLELHSDKTNKADILTRITDTLSLGEAKAEQDYLAKATEIQGCIEKLKAEMSAVHEKRYLGFSIYDAILNYFENMNAPDCLRIDSLFYEKLTETTFNKYLEILTELSLRAKECGDIDKSPFKHIGKFVYDAEWRQKGEAILDIYLMELKHLRSYAKSLLPIFNMRTVSLTSDKLSALYKICQILSEDNYMAKYFANYKTIDNAKGVIESYNEAQKRDAVMMAEYSATYGTYPQIESLEALREACSTGKYSNKLVRKLLPYTVEKPDRELFYEYILKCAENKDIIRKREEEIALLLEVDYSDASLIQREVKVLTELFENASKLYAECDFNIFNECCGNITQYPQVELHLEYYVRAYRNCDRSGTMFNKIFCINREAKNEEINQTVEYITNIEKNIDFIPSWCKYQEIVDYCKKNGFEFVLEPLNVGEITADDILRCFKKSIYYNFVRSEVFLDDTLCQFSALTLEETMNRFKLLSGEYEKLTRIELYNRLCASIPRSDTEGDHNLEKVTLLRAEKNNMKGTTIRRLFEQIPTILKSTCPCMLMSPTSVSQFLDIDMDKFDLVIFDEASQVPTCEAVCSIARGKEVIVVGDPNQLPPTSFFRNSYKDEEHYEVEDLESILDDCLSIGMPERHLLWHYRSNHESLIAFSNAMYYDNSLLTFPSPNEMNSRVSFQYVDGIYERGGAKCNKKEADELIKEVLTRLKNSELPRQSIGIVTFNTAQANYIEDKLSAQVHQNGLDSVAYEVDEPLFVKNLENVQGDERDIILFSVGYGPDSSGKLSLNFGPLNQNGGYKRLNVAVTRARSEMKVFSAITGNMIDLNRSDAKGVKGLKAFLEYAERGTEMFVIDSKNVAPRTRGLGAMIAADLKEKGLVCEYNVGVSNFKIDVAVVDPRNKDKYILGIICDSDNSNAITSVRDRIAMHSKFLKKLGWNTYHLWVINYFNNPKREINKIKDLVSALTEKRVLSKKSVKETLSRYKRNYKSFYIKPMAKAGADYVTNFANEDAIIAKIRSVIETESPIEEQYLVDKLLTAYNVARNSKKGVAQIVSYLEQFTVYKQSFDDKVFYVTKPVDFFRPFDGKINRDMSKQFPDEIKIAARCAIESKLNLNRDEIVKEVYGLFNCPKKSKAASAWIDKAVETAISNNRLICTPDGILKT